MFASVTVLETGFTTFLTASEKDSQISFLLSVIDVGNVNFCDDGNVFAKDDDGGTGKDAKVELNIDVLLLTSAVANAWFGVNDAIPEEECGTGSRNLSCFFLSSSFFS